MKRPHLVSAAISAAAIIAFLLLSRPSGSSQDSLSRTAAVPVDLEFVDKFAPVTLWAEPSPDVIFEDGMRAKRTARLVLKRGEAFAAGLHVPKERIRDFLDAKVTAGEIDHVLLFAEKNTKFGEVISILDECRKSHVQCVLLNESEV